MSTSEDRILKSIIRDMSEGVIVLGLDGVICYINPAADHSGYLRSPDGKGPPI